jgi:hypothetical protein
MAPDLQTRIRSGELTRRRANEIAEASKGISGALPLSSAVELGPIRTKPLLEVPLLHDYLTDAADWDADTWEFEPEGCARLARTLRWLYERMPEAFVFSATWGPAGVGERDVDRPELLQIVESNAVATRTVYKVRAG